MRHRQHPKPIILLIKIIKNLQHIPLRRINIISQINASIHQQKYIIKLRLEPIQNIRYLLQPHLISRLQLSHSLTRRLQQLAIVNLRVKNNLLHKLQRLGFSAIRFFNEPCLVHHSLAQNFFLNNPDSFSVNLRVLH